MNKLKFAALAVCMIFGTVSAQEVEKTMAFKIVVDGEGSAEPNVVSWSTDGGDLENLAVGESRTINGGSGNDVIVTRTEAGMEFNVNGETVVVPDLGQHGTTMAFVDVDGAHEVHGDIDVEVMQFEGDETIDVKVIGGGAHAVRAHPPEGVTIISDQTLDDSVKDSIRSVLISAGNDSEVRFIDGSEDGNHVRVIKKRVEIQQ
jgi:hypothetical protein